MINRKIRLCFFFDDLKLGGTQKLMSDVISLLDKDIFNIRIVVLESDQGDISIRNKLNVFGIKYLNIKTSIDLVSNVLLVHKETIGHDFVISFSSDSNLYCSIVKKYFNKLSYFICFTHGIDGYYINDKYYDKIKNSFGLLYVLKEKYLLNYYLKYYDKIITVCNSLRYFLTEVRNIEPKTIQTIYMGLLVDKYIGINEVEDYNSIRTSLGIEKDDFVIIYSGRLTYAKGLEKLIETFHYFKKNNKSIKLILLGNGDLQNYLKEEVIKYNLVEDCIFIDFNNDYLKYINAADLYLLPSISESTNLGVQEAMILKKLVLSSDTGGMPELIKDSINGFLFKCCDYHDLLVKLEDIYMNKENYGKIKEMARNEILERFNLTKNVKIIENLFIQLYNDNYLNIKYDDIVHSLRNVPRKD